MTVRKIILYTKYTYDRLFLLVIFLDNGHFIACKGHFINVLYLNNMRDIFYDIADINFQNIYNYCILGEIWRNRYQNEIGYFFNIKTNMYYNLFYWTFIGNWYLSYIINIWYTKQKKCAKLLIENIRWHPFTT